MRSSSAAAMRSTADWSAKYSRSIAAHSSSLDWPSRYRRAVGSPRTCFTMSAHPACDREPLNAALDAIPQALNPVSQRALREAERRREPPAVDDLVASLALVVAKQQRSAVGGKLREAVVETVEEPLVFVRRERGRPRHR